MLAVLGALLGFMGPFLPEVLKFVNRQQDNAHELEMFKLRIDAGKQEHLYRMDAMNTEADIAEIKMLHQPQTSFGVQMLDAAVKTGWGWWATVPAFYLMVAIDFFSGMLRSVVTYALLGYYVAHKYSLYLMAKGASDASFNWQEYVAKSYSTDDLALFFYVLAFWFGQREAKRVFGGSSMNARPSP